MGAKIVLSIVDVNLPVNGKSIVIVLEIGGVAVPVINIDFVNLRSSIHEVTAPTLAESDEIAVNFVTAWNLDFANSLGFSGRSIASVGAFPNEIDITFAENSVKVDLVTGDSITEGKITQITTNPIIEDEKTITLEGFEKYIPNTCEKVLLNISAAGGSNLYRVFVNDNEEIASTASPFQVQLDRSSVDNISVTDASNDDLIGQTVSTSPPKVFPGSVFLSIENTSSGSNVTITHDLLSSEIIPYTFSLDDITYKSENFYGNLAPGNYTLYIKDAFDCVIEKTFLIDGQTEIVETIFSISIVNALRFSLMDNSKKNHKNTLSHTELKKLAIPFIHRYTLGDIPPTQFKTNANYIDVFAMDETGNTTPLAPVKMTENIGVKEKSTSTYFRISEGISALKFGIVDSLDFVTEALIETVNYGFTLPEWCGTEGQLITIEGIGELPIKKIGYSDGYKSFVAEFDINHIGAPIIDKIISTTYNIQPYEVYEFDTEIASLPESFNVAICVGTDINNIDFTYVSERIKRVIDTDSLLEIDYWSIRNKGGMVYQTGIKHKIRLHGQFDYVGEQKTEGYNGDEDYFVTDNEVYDSQKFYFYYLSSEMAHKLRVILTHRMLNINGIFYKISESPEITTDISNNLKTLTVILKTGGDEFLTSDQEIIIVGQVAQAEQDSISAAIEASKGKSLILHSKT